MTATGSIVAVCRMCNGRPKGRFNFGACWSCPRRRGAAGHPMDPGAGFVLQGQAIGAFEPGDVIVEVYQNEVWDVVAPKAGRPRAKRRSDGFVWEEHSPSHHFVSEARAADPATWVVPEVPAPAAREPSPPTPLPTALGEGSPKPARKRAAVPVGQAVLL